MAWCNSSSKAALKNSMSSGQVRSQLIPHGQRLLTPLPLTAIARQQPSHAAFLRPGK